MINWALPGIAVAWLQAGFGRLFAVMYYTAFVAAIESENQDAGLRRRVADDLSWRRIQTRTVLLRLERPNIGLNGRTYRAQSFAE